MRSYWLRVWGRYLSLFASRHPHIAATMVSAIGRDGGRTDDTNTMSEIYRELQVTDFLQHLLPGAEALLRVLRVSHCGWNDLGTPERLVKTLRSLRAEQRRDVAQAAPRCLAVCLERMHSLPEGNNKNAKTLANITLSAIGTNKRSAAPLRTVRGS
jgi:hypothetical protein